MCITGDTMNKILKASKGMDCIKCGKPGAYACHLNGPRQHAYGKGRGIKCHPLMTAEFCYECDREFTEGSMLPRWNNNKWERSEEFHYWIALTNIRRAKEGIICCR